MRRIRVGHIADVHFGRLTDGHIACALADDVNTQALDAVLVTGDLTQRARRREFEAARAWLNELNPPALVLAGNHDVHAWWHRPDLRLIDPLRRYRSMISAEVTPSLEVSGMAVLGINTAHGWTVKGGRCKPGLDRIVARYFGERPLGDLRILAAHHPLIDMPARHPLDIARGGAEVLEAAVRAGVTLICGGHGHVQQSERLAVAGRSVWVTLAGTAASNRWRHPDLALNVWSVAEHTRSGWSIYARRYRPADRRFGSCDE